MGCKLTVLRARFLGASPTLPLSRDLDLCGKGPQETHHLGGREAERLGDREIKQIRATWFLSDLSALKTSRSSYTLCPIPAPPPPSKKKGNFCSMDSKSHASLSPPTPGYTSNARNWGVGSAPAVVVVRGPGFT